jgi:hypothetical protein
MQLCLLKSADAVLRSRVFHGQNLKKCSALRIVLLTALPHNDDHAGNRAEQRAKERPN